MLPELPGVDRVRSGLIWIDTTTCNRGIVGTGFLIGPWLAAAVSR
jgi:hypothetical protein